MTLQDKVRILDFAKQFEEFRTKKILCDVILLCENQEIPAHQLVLSAGCMYFRTIFTQPNDLEICNKSAIPIKGIKKESLEMVLKFIYSGMYPKDIENDNEKLKDVLITADILQIPEIAEYCRDHLLRNANLDNCMDLLDIVRYREQGDQMQKFAGENYDKLQTTKKFLELPIYDLKNLISCSKDFQSGDVILSGIIRWIKADFGKRQKNLVELVKNVDAKTLSSQCLHSLCLEPVINESLETLQILYLTATLRLENEDIMKSTSHRSKSRILKSVVSNVNEMFTHLKLDFIVHYEEVSFSTYTFYQTDTLWSPHIVLPHVSPSWFGFCAVGNYIYYLEKSNLDTKTFVKFHSHLENHEIIEFPYERYILFSFIDFKRVIYFHLSSNIFSYDPSTTDWSTILTDIPNANSVLLASLDYLFCAILDNQSIIRINPRTKLTSVHKIPPEMNLNKVFSQGICKSKIYFHGTHDKKFIVFNINNNDWTMEKFPLNICQLGDTWKLCSIKKELPCLYFIDSFNLLWEYYPKNDSWKRVSSDEVYVKNLIEIVVRV